LGAKILPAMTDGTERLCFAIEQPAATFPLG